MFPTIAANLFDFYFPNERSIAAVAPRGELLDTLSKPWSVQQIHEAGEAAMMRLLQNGHKNRSNCCGRSWTIAPGLKKSKRATAESFTNGDWERLYGFACRHCQRRCRQNLPDQ
jgi:hypothetical protein